MMTHYVDLSPNGVGLTFELYGRVLKAAHLSHEKDSSITVDWPMWRDEPGAFGPIIRLLGPQAAIERCLSRLAALIDAGLIRPRCDVSEVPATALYAHGYRRSRKPDKGSPSYVRRLQRRAQARGEPFDGVTPPWIKATHSVVMQSTTNEQQFHVYIERVAAAALASCRPNRYAMGVPVPSF